jgi:translocation and assembly module TamB
MTAMPPTLRRLLLALGVALGLIVLALAGLILWLNTDAGRESLLARIDSALGEAGLSLAVEAPAGRWPGRLAAASVTLADSAGPWLTIEDFELRWNPWALISRRIRVESLTAGSVAFERPPSLPERASPAQGGGLEPMRLLLRTRVEGLDVGRLQLGEALLGEASVWRVDGVIGAPDPAGVTHRLTIARIDGRDDRLDRAVIQDDGAATLSLRGEWR